MSQSGRSFSVSTARYRTTQFHRAELRDYNNGANSFGYNADRTSGWSSFMQCICHPFVTYLGV